MWSFPQSTQTSNGVFALLITLSMVVFFAYYFYYQAFMTLIQVN